MTQKPAQANLSFLIRFAAIFRCDSAKWSIPSVRLVFHRPLVTHRRDSLETESSQRRIFFRESGDTDSLKAFGPSAK
jgi:hypothetical protein